MSLRSAIRALRGAPAFRLTGLRVPACLVTTAGLGVDREGLAPIDLTIAGGRIASIGPAGGFTLDSDLPAVEAEGGIAFPRFVDIHTHLDKGQIWARRPNPDGTFAAALAAASADREAHWTAEDVRARMSFGLRAAFAYGTGAIRTHLDSLGPQTAITWPVFDELRAEWADRIALQGVSLFPIELALDDEAQFRAIVETAARHGGALGGVTFSGRAPDERTEAALDRLVEAASANGLDLDLHVDESGAPEARTLERVIDTVLMQDFAGTVICGHCCSLSTMEEDEMERVVERAAEARIAVVSLPMCNLYLQDRQPGRTPRWRGVAPLHELEAAGVPVMVASDNARDPFSPYGDLDMLEVFRESTRILHLDQSGFDWARAVASTPADLMRLDRHGRLEAGDPADLVLTRARSWSELFARPQSDRVVLVNGEAIEAEPPDYRELDAFLTHPLRHGRA
jgi:cytosine/creatinine deaminase